MPAACGGGLAGLPSVSGWMSRCPNSVCSKDKSHLGMCLIQRTRIMFPSCVLVDYRELSVQIFKALARDPVCRQVASRRRDPGIAHGSFKLRAHLPDTCSLIRRAQSPERVGGRVFHHLRTKSGPPHYVFRILWHQCLCQSAAMVPPSRPFAAGILRGAIGDAWRASQIYHVFFK